MPSITKSSPLPVCADESCIKRILESLQERIGPQKYNAWFRHGTQLNINDGHVHLTVPNSFAARWIEQHFRDALLEASAQYATIDGSLTVSLNTKPAEPASQRTRDLQADMVDRATEGRTRPRRKIDPMALSHSLDDFIVGSANRLAVQAARSLSSGGGHYSQLFVHGSCGVGKTHLLQGICRESARRMTPSGNPVQVRYVTGEQFTNEFVIAIRHKKMAEFRSRYRKLDLLAIDDVHFLASKRATQDEFLHTFNAIQAAGKQVILASDTHPKLVGKLNEQLVTRFQAGMVIKIDSPDRATRSEILAAKAKRLKLNLPTDVQQYIATHLTGSVRELEGVVLKLSALASLENRALNLELARDMLADDLSRTDSAMALGDIEAIVTTYFGVTPADLQSSRRTQTVSLARAVTMFLARRYTQMSFPEIGRALGKNHSSCVLACQRIEKLLAQDAPARWVTPAGKQTLPATELIGLLEREL